MHANPFKKTLVLMKGAFQILIWGLALLALAGVFVLLAEVIQNPDTSGPVYLALINLNLILSIGFIFFIARRLLKLFIERRGRMMGARLHVRLLAIFSILAVLPAIMVSVFSVFMLNQGIESWFSGKVNDALEGSLQVAQSYLEEHESRLLVEAKAISKDPTVSAPTFLIDPQTMNEILEREQADRALAEVAIYSEQGSLVAYAGDLTPSPLLDGMARDMHTAGMGAQVYPDLIAGRVVAMAPLDESTWLVLSRWIHPSVLARMDQTEAAYKEYYGLRKDRGKIRVIFTLFLVLLAVCSLAGAIWAGLRLASKIVRPVTSLVHAINKVSAGDLETHLNPEDDDEIGILTQSFNRMTKQLKESRNLLERKNRELDDRRRVIEAVLTGVSSGVLSLDPTGRVKVANVSARKMLGVEVGTDLQQIDEKLDVLFGQLIENNRDLVQQQVKIRKDDTVKTLLVRLVPLRMAGGKIKEVVMTFDNISELISAQRVAAWSDVARKLAHEIKNPLTPIKLSAERLNRKYLKNIKDPEEKALFQQLTEIIGRQVEDMRDMLNEFSDFARMPAAVYRPENVVTILNEILVLQRVARTNILFESDFEADEITMMCDRAQVARCFTNIIENAVNAINERPEDKINDKGAVKVVVKMSHGGTLSVTVLDNGCGLPKEMETERLFDPYVTTRKHGTGLGLAIVRRVVDEHGGQIRLHRLDEGGTSVEIQFPLNPEAMENNA